MSEPFYRRPSAVDRLVNRLVMALLRLGLAPAHMRVLEVRGRRTGQVYALPVDLLTEGERLFLVAPRGYTQWVRNAEAAGVVVLRRGSQAREYSLRPVSDTEKPRVLKAYLDRFRREVQRYFPVSAGSPLEAFGPIAPQYPAYELTGSRH
jgi:deazaflavin-dependent oxidoreductase (nitroreductase family)